MTSTLMDPQTQGRIVVEKFCALGVSCSLAGVIEAPQITRIEIAPGEKTKMWDFMRLHRADDLAFALGAPCRIVAPSPGQRYVAVEIAREDRQVVGLEDLPNAVVTLA